MRVKKEVIVLLGALLVLGLLVMNRLDQQTGRARTRSQGSPPVFEELPAPNTALVDPLGRDPLSWERDPFSEPRDTRPLAPLPLEDPPLPALEALLPPPSVGPAPAYFGQFLRRPLQLSEVRGLFVTSDDELGEDFDEFGSDADLSLTDEMRRRLEGLGYVEQPTALADLSSEEREERIASWRRLYDWIKLSELETLYGSIQNEDPYGLEERPGEGLSFLEVNPETGLDRYPGQGPVTYPRERVLEYKFADTPAHRIAEWRHAIGDTVSPGQLPEVLEFGAYCVTQRLEAPEALATAEEVFELLIAQFPDDPAPRLGLARTYEVGFRLEDAYAAYLGMLEEFGHHAGVHVALAQLEARLRLFESAEERLAEALRIDRASWRVQWALARYHAERGHWAQALEYAEAAHRFAPAASYQDQRTEIRNELGAARMANGDPQKAREIFEQVLKLEQDNSYARAGLHAAYVLDPSLETGLRPDQESESELDVGFELLIGRAIESMAYGQLDAAEAQRAFVALETAAEMDPLRAWQAWRALSWLAEVTGYPEEAYQYIEYAYEANPTDAWTLYQRGRLLAQRDDPFGARESFQAALAEETDFSDALVALAELAYRGGAHDDAERYYERAVALDPQRSAVRARRGLNYLQLGELQLARSSFEGALQADPENGLARAGLAWCAYREGDTERARQLYAELDDLFRNRAEDDPFRVFAREQMERVEEHLNKEQWTDRFERRSLRRGWHPDEMASPTISLVDGQMVMRGTFERDGRVRAFQTLAAPRFVSLEAVLTVGPENNARVGIFVAKERQLRGGGSEATSEIAVGRHRDGPVQVKVRENSSSEAAWVDLEFPEWPVGQPVRVRIEREGEGSSTTGRLLVDDFTVLEGAALRSLFASTSDLRFGIFVEGSSGRQADLAVDVVDVVRTIR